MFSCEREGNSRHKPSYSTSPKADVLSPELVQSIAMAVILSLLALFIVLRSIVRAAPRDRSLRALFVPVPKTSQSIYTLETDD